MSIYIGGASNSALTTQILTASGSVTTWGSVVLVDCTSGSVTVTLPSSISSNKGQTIIIKKIDSTSNNVRIISYGTEKLDGVAGNSTYLYNSGESVSYTSLIGDASITADNRNSTGGTASFLRATTTAVQAISGANNLIKFTSVSGQVGSKVTLDSTGAILLKKGSIYDLRGSIGYAVSSSITGLGFQWRTGNVAGSGTLIGTMGQVDSDGATGASSPDNPFAEATYEAIVDTYVHLETITSAITQAGISNIFPFCVVEEKSRQATLINTVDNLYVTNASAQTFSSAGDIILTKQSGNLYFDGIYASLIAGKTYNIIGIVSNMTTTDATGNGVFAIVDSLNNKILDNFGKLSNTKYSGATANFNTPIVNIQYTPKVNTNIKLRLTDWANGSLTIGFASLSVSEAGSTGTTSVPSTLIDAPWMAYTPTFGCTGTMPTLGTNTIKGLYRVIGKTLHLKFAYSQTSAGTVGNGVYTISLPSSYAIDLDKVPVPSSIVPTTGNKTPAACIPLGIGKVNTGDMVIVPLSSTTVGMYMSDASNSGLIGSVIWALSSASTTYQFTAEIPILN